MARASAGSVQFAWDPGTDTNVIGYNVYLGLASHAYTFVIPFGSVSNATISGLRGGVTYYFAVVACNSDGSQSAFSDEVSQFIPTMNHPATPFADISGAYNGLFLETDQVHQTSAGSFSLFVNGRGVYSGHLQSGSIRASFHGQLDPWLQGTNVVVGPNNNSFVIQFRIGGDTGQSDQLAGQVSDGSTVSSLVAARSPFNARTFPAPFAGQYTCVIPGQGTDRSAPQGYGFGVARVSASGSAIFFGTLADGTHISQSAPISGGGVWPLYVPLYSGAGSLISLLTFTNRINDDLNGMISWTRPGMPNTRYYSAGFTNQSQMIGSIYTVPSPLTQPVLDLPNTFIAFTGGELGSGFTNTIGIGRSSRVANQSPNRLDMTFSIATGTFRGNVVDPLGNRTMPFCGVAFQKNTSGFGLLLGTDQTSSVLLGL